MGTKKATDPKTHTVVVKEQFYTHLEQLVDYIAFRQKQPLNALKTGNGIQKTVHAIIANPLIFAQCENIPTKTSIYREARYKSWLIVFKVHASQITILGVLSSKQKPTAYRKLTK